MSLLPKRIQLILILLFPALLCRSQSAMLDSIIGKTGRERLPGFSVRVLKDNQPIYEYSCGMANIRKQIPMSPRSVVDIASVSKQFTAYGIFLLESRGKLQIEQEIHTFLPELPDFGSPITIRHLLSHTSGLRDYPDFIYLLNESTKHNLSYQRMVSFLKSQHELNFQPGTQFCYSNTGYMMLSRIIEVVTGKTYAEFMQEEIFTPLQMTHTFVNEGSLSEQSDGTTNYALNTTKTKATRGHAHRDVIGATGIYTSIEDLSKWNKWFYEHESGLNYSPVIARMETSFTLNDGSPVHYGGGLLLKEYRGKQVVEHSGGWGEYLTQYRRFPSENLTIIVTTNSTLDSPFDICDKLSNALLTFNEQLPESQVHSCYPLEKLNGVYLSEDNVIRHITAIDPQHIMVLNATKTNQLRYVLVASECLENNDTTLFFQDSCGGILEYIHRQDSTREFIWNKGAYFQNRHHYLYNEPAQVIPEKRIKGHYYSPELDLAIRVRYNYLRHEYVFILYSWMRVPLKPIAKDVYQLEGETYLVRFRKNGLFLGNDWIYNLKFYKQD